MIKINKKDENYVYYLVGKNLRKELDKKDMSIVKFARLSNYSEGFIKNITSSKYPQTFSLGTIWHFADVLGVDIRVFFEPLDEDDKYNQTK